MAYRCKAELAVFLRDDQVGTWIRRTADGWRLFRSAGGVGRGSVVDVTIDLTGQARCSCAARRRPCKHLLSLAAVGLLDGAAVPC
jgi:SWIM zinc finger